MSVSPEAREILEWREAQRRKHRTMTLAEYRAWCAGGDAISSPIEATGFPGGLTILFGTREQRDIIGTVG